MCLAVPMKIVKIDGSKAVVEAYGVERIVDITLINEPAVDDKVIIHAGFAIEKLDPEMAGDIEETWDQYVAFLKE